MGDNAEGAKRGVAFVRQKNWIYSVFHLLTIFIIF